MRGNGPAEENTVADARGSTRRCALRSWYDANEDCECAGEGARAESMASGGGGAEGESPVDIAPGTCGD